MATLFTINIYIYTRYNGTVTIENIYTHYDIEGRINYEPLAGRFDGNGLRASKFGAAANEVVWNRLAAGRPDREK